MDGRDKNKPNQKPKPKGKGKPKNPNAIDPKMSKDTQQAVNETNNYFNEANKTADKYGLNTPSTKLDLTSFEDLVNPTSPNYAGNRSSDTTAVLNRLKEGMNGLNSNENQALREQAVNEINRQALSNQAQSQQSIVKNRLRGAVADRVMAKNDENKLGAIKDYEQKNLVDNVKLKQDATNQYANVLGSTEQNEFGRVNDLRTTLLGGRQFNIDMEQKDKAQHASNLAGLGGIIQTQANNNNIYKLTKDGQRRSGSGSSRTNTTRPATTTTTTKKPFDEA